MRASKTGLVVELAPRDARNLDRRRLRAVRQPLKPDRRNLGARLNGQRQEHERSENFHAAS